MSINFVKETIAKYIMDPELFFIEQFGVTVDPWQRKLFSELLSKRFVAVRSGNGPGKTFVLAGIALWFFMTRPYSKVVCIAVNQKQLDSTLWAEIHRLRDRSKLICAYTRVVDDQIRMDGAEKYWFIVARAAVNSRGDVQEALQGMRAPWNLFVVDEASGVPDKAIDALESSATVDTSYAVMCSNPTRASGYFYNAFHKNRSLWANIHVRPEDTSRVSPEFYKRMELKYGGRNTNGYRIRVLGEFPLAESVGLVTYEEYQEVRNTWYDPVGDVFLSIDPAGSSPDSDMTTVGIMQGKVLHDIRAVHGLKVTEVAGWIKEIIGAWDPKSIFIDSIGIGAGMADMLESEGLPVVRVNVGSGPADEFEVNADGTSYNRKGDYFNRRAQLFYRARWAIKQKKVYIAQDLPLLEADLTDLRFETTVSGKFKVEAKESFRARNDGRSPDYGDAFALLFAHLDLVQHEVVHPVDTTDDTRLLVDASEEMKKTPVWQYQI